MEALAVEVIALRWLKHRRKASYFARLSQTRSAKIAVRFSVGTTELHYRRLVNAAVLSPKLSALTPICCIIHKYRLHIGVPFW